MLPCVYARGDLDISQGQDLGEEPAFEGLHGFGDPHLRLALAVMSLDAVLADEGI